MKYSFYKTRDKEFCSVLVDKSSSNGILKFSHEIDITFVKEGIWKFFSAWHCGVSEMFWTAAEEDDFNDLFPGVLKEIKDYLQDKNGSKKKLQATCIKWADAPEEIILPTEVDIPDDISLDKVDDYLSDLTGFLHEGYVLEEVEE